MKKIILTILSLLLVVGCSKVEGKQDLIPVVETHNSGTVSKIRYHKITGNKIEMVKMTWWYENGQKEYEGTYKDGKLDGKWTDWYENGQKKYEGIYKDGKKVDEKEWDKDGNLK